MCSFPASLFHASLLPLKANKPVLADAIWSMTEKSQPTNDQGQTAYFVIDGGALPHRVVWPRGLTCNAICLLDIQYMQCRYPSATIVLDGYNDGPSRKDCTHQRRGHSSGQAVLFKPDMICTLKKDNFLSHAEGDADGMIVDSAATKARRAPLSLLVTTLTCLCFCCTMQKWMPMTCFLVLRRANVIRLHKKYGT